MQDANLKGPFCMIQAETQPHRLADVRSPAGRYVCRSVQPPVCDSTLARAHDSRG
jgi:hypothetical protein